MRRWTIRVVACLLLLLLIAVVAVHIVPQTDLPRRWILQAARKRTGLDVLAESVSIRWSGRTTIRNVTVKMPLNDTDLLSADTIELSHTSVPVLLLTGSFRLGSVRVEGPQAYLRRDGNGRWDVQDVADRLDAAAASSGQRGGPAALPNVDVERALIHIIDPNGAEQTIGPLEFQGIAEKRSVWKFALQGQQGIELYGELAEGANWAHTVEFHMEPNEAALQTVLRAAVGPVRVAGGWDGCVEGRNLRGTIRLDALEAGSVALAGNVRVATESDGLTLSPEDLVLSEPNLAAAGVHITGGKIQIGRSGIVAEELLARTETLAGQLTGRWDRDARAGECSARWAGRLPGQNGDHSGTCRAALKSPKFGLKEAEFTTTLAMQTSLGSWRIAVQTQGAGREWQRSLWQTSLHKLTWTQGRRQIDLSGAAAEVSVAWPSVKLAGLSLPNAEQVNADAELNLDTRQWAMRLNAKGLRPSKSGTAGVDIHFDGAGDNLKAVVSELRVAEGPTEVSAKGELSIPLGEVRNVHVSAQWPDRLPTPEPAQPPQGQGRGQWGCEIDVTGKVRPVALDTSATVTGRNVRLGKRKVAQLQIPVQGRVDTERIQVATSPFDLLGGRWQLSGQHELSKPLTQLHLTISDLSLQTAAEMAGSPVKCQGQATAQLRLAVPDFRMDRAQAFGSWDVVGLSIPPLEAQEGHGQIRISDGLVSFDEIQLTQAQGRARGAMQFRLDEPQRFSVKLNVSEWPLRWDSQAVALVADSEATLELDLLKKSLDGEGRLSSRLLLEDKEFGRMNASMRLHERVLEVDELRGDLLGGRAEGTARIPWDRLSGSTGQLQWYDIRPELLAPWWPQASRSAGRLSGSLKAVQTTEEQRAMEPIRVDVEARFADGRFGTAQVQDCNVVAYLGSRRFLIDKSSFRLLGGDIKGRARVSRHTGKLYLSIAADVNNLDLNQLSHAIEPDAKPIVGRLSGKGTLLTSSDWRHLSGQADLSITQSDLANNAIIRTLYDTLSLDLGQTRPEGTGQVGVIFEGTRVRIPSFVYFNRGVEMRGAGGIKDLTLGPESPVDGYAVGSTRVLKDVRLPGVRQLDRLMASLQTSIASVTIKGTLGQTKVDVVPLPVVSDALRGLLWTQLRE
ncbi:MAG: hypothetical protein JW955_16835 [Sedimentisphaerales bacterium]|nr:hypothetical protein [Sedimentisphaerales bacterium]